MKYTKRKKVFQGLAQLIFMVETIQHKKDPDADGNRINQYLKDKFVVDFKITGRIKGEISQPDDSSEIQQMKNAKAS